MSADRKTAGGFLLTDHYQLTMAQTYFSLGLHDTIVQFDHYFRNYPDYGAHKAGYCINAGLQWLTDWMLETVIADEEVEYLRRLRGPGGNRVFQDDFLQWLSENGRFDTLSLRSIPEGRVIHPNEPINSVKGPVALCQLLETALINTLNYQILVATKAARIKHSAGNRPVVEFGLRRAQERSAAAGSRAALIGGVDGTSYVGAARMLGLSSKGTHAHSMIQFLIATGMSELDAFRAFAQLYPDNCILLVDTIDTLNSGIPNAIKVFHELSARGHRPLGIRLDSGDLAYLTMEAHRMLNAEGFSNAWILLSNELDELLILQILEQIRCESSRSGIRAEDVIQRLVYGVGTKLITSWGYPSLNAVYKLTAVKRDGDWQPVMKLSDSPGKTPIPGLKDLWRIYNGRGMATADLVCCAGEKPASTQSLRLRHPEHPDIARSLNKEEIREFEPLHIDVLAQGKLVCDFPDLDGIIDRRRRDLDALDSGVKRLINPHRYHVSLSDKLFAIKEEAARRLKSAGNALTPEKDSRP